MLDSDPGNGFYRFNGSNAVPEGDHRLLNPAEIDRIVDVPHVVDVRGYDVERTCMASATVLHLHSLRDCLSDVDYVVILSAMTIEGARLRRRRRQPEELRREAIAAARDILERQGPAAITLQSVAATLGMAHGNITHHFGTAANLQAAVADEVIAELLEGVRSGVRALRAGSIDEARLVDLIFDTFDQTGVGRLIGWLVATDRSLLGPLIARFGRLPRELADVPTRGSAIAEDDLPAIIESIVTSALGASLIGADLDNALHLPKPFARRRVAQELIRLRAANPECQDTPSNRSAE